MRNFRQTILISTCLLTMAGFADMSIAQTTPAAPAPATATPKPAAPVLPVLPAAPPADPITPDVTVPADDPSAADSAGAGDVSIGEIPSVETEELTADLAKKAIDGYTLVHDKYQDSPLEDYQDLQEFVDKDPKGKEFEKDIQGFGFKTVNEWNLAVTSVSVAYNNILDDQTADLKQQIEDIKKSVDLAQDMKDKAIKSLQNSIPSDNNHKIVEDLTKDPAYSEKIKILESTEE
jgi:hypothetical protein